MSHQIAFFLAWVPLYFLLRSAHTKLAFACGAVYAVPSLFLLVHQRPDHRRNWSRWPRARMYSIDHSATFVLIAGSYTPITLLAVGGARGVALCAAIWAGAGLGIAQILFWKHAPRWLHVSIYVVLGWAGALGLVPEARSIGSAGMSMHVSAASCTPSAP